MDTLDESLCQYYEGAIVLELRDFRGPAGGAAPESHRVLLRPSSLSLINEIHVLSEAQASRWPPEFWLEIERKALLVKEPTLCLDPNPNVCRVLNVARYNASKTSLFVPRHKRTAALVTGAKAERDQQASYLSVCIYILVHW